VRDVPPEPPLVAVTAEQANAAAPETGEAANELVTSRSAADSSKSLRAVNERVARALQSNRDNRRLSTDVNAAWQIMHGVLAYGNDLQISTPSGPQPAVKYLLTGGAVRGFELRGGDTFQVESADGTPATQLRGVVTDLDAGSKVGQGHRDQWLAYMARCGLTDDDVVMTSNGPLTVAGWIRQIQWDVPRNFENEFSWTLTALIAHRPTTERWKARDGREYNIESLLDSELQQLAPENACGGSHRLCAIASALNEHRKAGHAIIGVWAEAQHVVQLAIDQAKEFQNDDGSFSSYHFERPGWSLDLATALGTTGHVFEFLAIAVSDEALGERWMQAGANFLCRTLEQTAELDLECGALYHALSGLSIYEERTRPADGL
jgi:hypothetical protein